MSAAPWGRPQGGMLSEEGRAAYWRMQWESAIGALADLIAEHAETVEGLQDALTKAEKIEPSGSESEQTTHDLADRLRTAVARLEHLRDRPTTGGYEKARLNGKIDGVKLAASYIEEGERIFPGAVSSS